MKILATDTSSPVSLHWIFKLLFTPVVAIGLGLSLSANAEPYVAADSDINAGRYLVTVAGCNDCHTAGYADTGGAVSEDDWLTGSPVGWRGPWGTTYPSNLRLLVQDMSEDEWVAMLRTRSSRPPMPWMNVNKLSERDMLAMYEYLRYLGPKGERMPASASPEEAPHTPYILLEPLHLERLQELLNSDTAK